MFDLEGGQHAHDADNLSDGASARARNEHNRANVVGRGADRWEGESFEDLHDHVALLDGGGNIVLVSQGWTRFAAENGASDQKGVAAGANYLEICRSAAETNDEESKATLAGIVSVLNGAAQHFEREYPCHSPTEQRWFLMTATRLDMHGEIWALLSHRDITAARALRQPRIEGTANKTKSVFPLVGSHEMQAATGAAAANILCLTCPSQHIGLCGDFNEEEKHRFFHASSRLEIAHDHALVREGEPSRHVLSVISGALMISRVAADGRRFVTDFIWPGEVTGLFAEEKSAFTAVALGPTEVCRHSHRQLQKLTAESASLGRHLFLRQHAELAAAQGHALLLGCASARARLAHFLLRLQERQRRQGHKMSARVDLPMRRPDIASHLSMTVETLSRMFQDLVRRKLILPVPNGVRILARDSLVAISEDAPENVSLP